MWQLMYQMYKNEGGFRALYRGITPTVAGVAPYVRTKYLCLLIEVDGIRLVSISWSTRPCAASSPNQATETQARLGSLLPGPHQVQ